MAVEEVEAQQEVRRICVEDVRHLVDDVLYALLHAGQEVWDYAQDLVKGRIRMGIEDLKEHGCIRDVTYRDILEHLEHALKAAGRRDLSEFNSELDLVLDRVFVDLLR